MNIALTFLLRFFVKKKMKGLPGLGANGNQGR